MNIDLNSIGDIVNKQTILNKISQEQILEYYLGVKITKKNIKSPLRPDNKPTCSFYKNRNGDIYFHDFGTGQSFNWISLVMYKFNCSYYSALRKIAKDFNITNSSENFKEIIISTPKLNIKEKSKISIISTEFSKKDLEWWSNFGISEKTLKLYNVYRAEKVYLNNRLFSIYTDNFPSYGYYGGKLKNDEFWRIYYPTKDKFRFLSNWSKDKIQGLNQLPDKGKLLVITKSMKDVMAMREYGIPAISPISESLFIDKILLDELKSRFKYIVVMYDNDKAGMHSMYKIRKKYPELYYFYIPKIYGTKDFSDTIKKYGNLKNRISNVLKYFKNYLNEKNGQR